MTFPIPAVDQLGWGEPLQKHLAQLNDPEMGGINHVLNVQERNSKYWDNGALDKDEYKNKTVYVVETGTFHVWTVTESRRYWRELSKNINSGDWIDGPGTVESYGYELRGIGTKFTDYKANDLIKVLIPGTAIEKVYQIESVISDTIIKTPGVLSATTRSSAGGQTANQNPIQGVTIVSATSNTITFSTAVSSFDLSIKDTIITWSNYYAYTKAAVVTGISGSVATVEWTYGSSLFDPAFIDPGSFTVAYKISPTSYAHQIPLLTFSGEEGTITTFQPSGTVTTVGTFLSRGVTSNTLMQSSLGNSAIGTIRQELDTLVSRSITMQVRDNQGWQANRSSLAASGPEGHIFEIVNLRGPIAFHCDTLSNSSFAMRLNRNTSAIRMEVNGNQAVTGNITATGTITPGSDERWKTDIKVIESPLTMLTNLKGVTYYWNQEEQQKRDSDIHIGLIAQDALNIPGAVKVNEEGYLHLDYMGLVGLLVETNKELLKKVQVLEERISSLESK